MEENVKVPFWQKTWFVVLACIFVPPAGLTLLWVSKKGGMVIRIILTVILVFYSFAWLSGVFGGNSTHNNTNTTNKTEAVTEQSNTNNVASFKDAADKVTADKVTSDKAASDKAAADKAAADKAAAEQKSSDEVKSKPTIGQKNALIKAGSYLAYTSFSYAGLIEQLQYDKFTVEDATYAVDSCGADWNKQAAKKAQTYLDYSSFSRGSLIEQLMYDEFTREQSEYGATAVGY